jgi:hypothetical protein
MGMSVQDVEKLNIINRTHGKPLEQKKASTNDFMGGHSQKPRANQISHRKQPTMVKPRESSDETLIELRLRHRGCQ